MNRWLLSTDDVLIIVHYTRNWFHYGTIGFISMCALAAALRGVFGASK